MHVCIVDRKGAQAIWRLMNAISDRVIDNGGQVRYVRMDDGAQREPIATPDAVRVTDIRVSPKKHPWDIFRQHARVL